MVVCGNQQCLTAQSDLFQDIVLLLKLEVVVGPTVVIELLKWSELLLG